MKRNHLIWITAVALFAALLAQAGPVSAQQPTPSDNDVNRVAKQLYCPVCENTPLDVCPTQACEEWRELIRLKLSEGWSDEQIKDYFALQYGDRVLAEPPRRGLNWLVYILPIVFFAGGVVILVSVLRRMRAPAKQVTPSTPALDAETLKRVEEELKKHDIA
ncbi:MAG: cytochrome c-type biogenesis protein CcmH [Anaerolineaceae bacterium]|nr:cytochrome c-type biogenesis protein CcmH [Anaerolineaceae bacterium]